MIKLFTRAVSGQRIMKSRKASISVERTRIDKGQQRGNCHSSFVHYSYWQCVH